MLDPEVRHRALQVLGIEVRALPRDGDGDGFYSPRKGAPDKTPVHPMQLPGGKAEGASKKAPDGAPKPRVAAAAGRYHEDLGELQDLVDAIESGEKSRTEMHGGREGATSLVVHNNGTKTINKVLADDSMSVGADLGSAERQADAEQLGSQLGQRIGAPVPRVLRTGPDEIWVEFVDGEDFGESLDRLRPRIGASATRVIEQRMKTEMAATADGIRLGLFDLLTAGWDRNNNNNIMVTPGQNPVGIDHAFAWSGDLDPDPDVPPVYDYAISPFAESWVAFDPARGAMTWADNPLTPEDVDWLRGQLADAEGDFDALGRHDWWEFASARLEAIAPHATGTESRFAT